MNKKECAIIDTCVLLSDPDVIVRAAQIGFPVLTNIVFEEIDYNKDRIKRNPDDMRAKRAASIFRKLKHQTPSTLDAMPCGKALQDGDTLYKYEFESAPLFVITRSNYRTNTSNDAKIREVSKDYDLILVTEDGGNKTLADLDGIRAVVWAPKSKRAQETYSAKPQSAAKARPFKRVSSITEPRGLATQPLTIPAEGDHIMIGSNSQSIELGRQIGAGGEGQVFELVGDSRVAKIYHADQLTANRIAKLDLMASRAVSRKEVCWPEQLVYSLDKCAVGYVMQRAHGYPLQKSVFVKPLLLERFPNWRRENLVNTCIALLEHLQYLHSLNVLVGDINPMNVLVHGDGNEVFIVDADSFQVEGFPCPVGTVNFSPSQLQNVNFKSILRSKDDELFAIATMLFMILVPGKPPYSQQGGESPEKNIIEANFPYPLGDDHKSKNVSPGPWRYIWSHLPYRLKELFHKAFRENQRIVIDEWLAALRAYKNDISKEYVSNDLFPAGHKVPKGQGVNATCTRQGCGRTFEMFRDNFEDLKDRGQSPICPECLRVLELERLARTAAAASDTNEKKGTAPLKPRQTVFSNLRKAGANSSSKRSRAQSQRTNSSPQKNSSKQTTTNDSGLKTLAVFAAVVIALGLMFGWWIIPVVLVVLVLIGFLGGKLPH